MTTFKKTINSIMPAPVLQALQLKRILGPYAKMPPSQVFTDVYEKGLWGWAAGGTKTYYSGAGSHDENIVGCYVDAVDRFLASLEKKPNVVDIGCGDFAVGSRIRPLCDGYIACDVVEPLIAFNKEKYRSLNVEFTVLDLASDPLPKCDVLFIRQVLQHLSNTYIQNALPKISSCCQYFVLTEHHPLEDPFVPNLDIIAGPETRMVLNSGVVLDAPPFNFKPIETTTLCEVVAYGGRIRTSLFRLR